MLYFLLLLFPCLLAAEFPKPDATIFIPMRDGSKLATDFYFPCKETKKLPCLLVRSPAGRNNPYALMFVPLLKDGYTIAIQETRSVKDPEGKTLPYESDGWGEKQDGYDTVKFLEKSSYTNGKIGTIGASAMGITQLLMAPTNPPGLGAQYISFATSDLFNQAMYEGGELCKDQVEKWLAIYAKHPDVYRTIYTQPDYSPYWDSYNTLTQASNCHTPALHVGGWYDVFLRGTLSAYTKLQNEGGDGAKGEQRLVIGPWSHLWPYIRQLGEYEYPQAALEPTFDFSPEKWFAAHLKGEPLNLPNVVYYVMGPFNGEPSSGNVWKSASEWPVPYKEKPLYLSSKNALVGENPAKTDDLSFNYDPENPVPTAGGRNLFLPAGPIDQKVIEERSDMLVFTTEPLEEDFEITGALEAILFVATDAEDTAFSVRLTDVYPDGKSLLIADGITRFSHGLAAGSTISKMTPQEITIDLASTSLVFAKGHKIRVAVSSSNYPRFEKNFNSLKRAHENPEPIVAKNTIFTGPDTPSRIVLPVSLNK